MGTLLQMVLRRFKVKPEKPECPKCKKQMHHVSTGITHDNNIKIFSCSECKEIAVVKEERK